jgi:SAM-dependent methyltransferase
MGEIDPPIIGHPDAVVSLVPVAGRRVVDVGCGDGTLVRALTRLGAEVTGIDIDSGQLAPARAAAPAGAERYLEGRGEALPLADGSVDLVLYCNSLHHVPAEAHARALAEAARVLVSGGAALILEPLAEGDWFELVKPVEDETQVRAQAYAAILAVPADLLAAERETLYRHPLCFTRYAQAEARILAVDPSRAEALECLRPLLTQRFEASGEARVQGRWFHQPTRANLLRKG